jgi:hypothetical protein
MGVNILICAGFNACAQWLRFFPAQGMVHGAWG